MTRNQDMFDERYRRVIKRHRQLSQGYTTRVGRNGVINHQPMGNFRNFITWKMVVLPLMILVFLKACMVTVLGEERYADQVASLHTGSASEQIAGFFLQMDPLTWPVAQLLSMIIG